MRITDNMRFNTTVTNLLDMRSRYNDLMEKIATQKKVNRASDDPIAAAKILDIRQGIAANEQYRKNIADSDTWVSVTESALSGAYDLLTRARGIALGEAGGTADASSRRIAAQNIQSYIDEMAALANEKIGDRYLFSGSRNGVAPFSTTSVGATIEAVEQAGNNVFTGTAASSGTYSGNANKTYVVKITGNQDAQGVAAAQISTDDGRTWEPTALAADGGIDLGDNVKLTIEDAANETFGENDIFVVHATAGGYYQGNNDQISMTINRRVTIAYNVTGTAAFTGSNGAGVDIFKTLNDLKDALENNDAQGISGQLENLKNAQEQVLLNQSLCGTRANHLEMAKNSLVNLDERLTLLLSDAQDADLAELATRLSMQEIALQASYAMAAKISDTTILNFLK